MSKFVNNFEYGTDTLLLQSYYGAYVNVLENGVSLDGADQLANIQNIIDNNPNKVIYFPDGVYNISDTINTSATSTNRVVLYLSKYATIKASNVFPAGNYVIDIGGKDSFDINDGTPLGIIGGIIDTNYRASGIKVEKCHMAVVSNLVITNLAHIGIDIEPSQNASADAQIRNVIVYGQPLLATNIGLVLNSSDNNINTFRTMHTGKGIVLNNGGNILNDCHVLCSEDTMTDYNNTVGYEVNSEHNQFDDIYSDNYSVGIYFKPALSYFNVVGKYFAFWYSASAGKTHAFISGMFNNIIIGSVSGAIPALGDNYIWHYTDTDIGRESQINQQIRGINIGALKVTGHDHLKYQMFDYGFATLDDKATYFSGGSLAANTWIPVGAFVIPTVTTLPSKIGVSLGYDTYADIYFSRAGIIKVDLQYAGATGRKLDATMSNYTAEGNMFKVLIWVRPNFDTDKRVSTISYNGWCKQLIMPSTIDGYSSTFVPTTSNPTPSVGSIVSSNTW